MADFEAIAKAKVAKINPEKLYLYSR